MDRFIGGTAGATPRGGNITDDEMAEFFARGQTVKKCEVGESGGSIRKRDVFGRTIKKPENSETK